MEPNHLYYTFSTIPQVLAGIIALLGAFWIYRNENLNKKLKSTGRSILREMGVPIFGESQNNDSFKDSNRELVQKGLIDHEKLSEQKAKQWIDRLSIRMNSSIDQDDYDWIGHAISIVHKYASNPITEKAQIRFKKITEEKKNFAIRTKWSIGLSALTILLSTATLPFERFIDKNECLRFTTIVVVGGFFLISIGIISYSLIKTLSMKDVA